MGFWNLKVKPNKVTPPKQSSNWEPNIQIYEIMWGMIQTTREGEELRCLQDPTWPLMDPHLPCVPSCHGRLGNLKAAS